MKALTSVQPHDLRFDFPEISRQLHDLTLQHLKRRIETDQDPHWREAESTRTRSECERKAEELAQQLTADILPGASIRFQRTLRIPDDHKIYPLPPGLGAFPLRHVDDFSDQLPASWRDRGGIMLPVHQSEALWLYFSSAYPIALKVGTGKICAVSGEPWQEGLSAEPQNYCVLPAQPWLDGFAVEKGVIRQFVAQPLGAGFTVEEQLTGEAEWGGIQLQAHPLKAETYWNDTLRELADEAWEQWLHPRQHVGKFADMMCCSLADESGMGLAAGGRMKQEIFEDRYQPSDYLESTGNRCFVHLCNSAQWELITGSAPPDSPPTARDYSRHGFPWFEYYDEKQSALPGGEKLKAIKSVKQLESETGQKVLPDNEEAKPKVIVKYIKE